MRIWGLALVFLAGCLPTELPEGEPPIPYNVRQPALSDYEMDHAREDITDASIAYLEERKVAYRDLIVKVWPNLGVAVTVMTDATDERVGQGLVNRLHKIFNRNAYLYRPTGYDYVFKVIIAKN